MPDIWSTPCCPQNLEVTDAAITRRQQHLTSREDADYPRMRKIHPPVFELIPP